MSKKTNESQMIGKKAVDILNCKLMYNEDSDFEFSFVPIPQEHDFGLDGILNVFKDKKYESINPFVQVKGTNTEIFSKGKKRPNKSLGYKIDVDWDFLKEKTELSILIAINTKKQEVYYTFPQFEDKPKSFYLHSFPHKLDSSPDSKKNLYELIESYRLKSSVEYKNSVALQEGKGFSLLNDFELKLTNSGFDVVSKTKKAVDYSIKLNFPNPTESQKFQEEFGLFIEGKKDKIAFKKDWIVNLEQLNGWEIGNQMQFLASDIILRRPLYYTGEILLQVKECCLKVPAICYSSVESQSFIVESPELKDTPPFWFSFNLNNSSNDKFEYKINRDKISSPSLLFSIYNFLLNLNNNKDFSIFLKKGYGFESLYSATFNEILPLPEDYNDLKYFARVESDFKSIFDKSNMKLNLPEKYSKEDIRSVIILGKTLEDLEFYTLITDKNQYEEIKRLPGLEFYLPARKSVIFNNKKLTIFASGLGKYIKFNDNNQVGAFQIEKLDSIKLVIEDTENKPN